MNTLTTLPPHISDLLPDYREPGYLIRLARMARGFRQPRASREHKEAIIEFQRLSAPVSAIFIPALAVLLLILFPARQPPPDHVYDVQFLPDIKPPPLIDLNDLTKPDDPTDPVFATPTFTPPEAIVRTEADVPPQRVSKAPAADWDTIPRIRGSLTLPTLIGANRGAGARNTLIAQYEGDQKTEDAVLRALRWLKKNQQPDGAWPAQRIAMTGLGLLTFLAHGEVPDSGKSPEFSETVHRAITFLLSNQKADGLFHGGDGNGYAHPIAAYALCEAFGMTLNPTVKAAAEQALVPIIKGQHPTGGWTYKMDPNVNRETGTYRDDTSYMGWCVQAIKAAQLAKLNVDGLEKAGKLAVRGFKNNANPSGGFGYTGPGQGGLTGVGTLCLQLLGASSEREVRRSADLMDRWHPSFEAKGLIGNSPQYACYYATQSKFHSGGKRWESWNTEMKLLYVNAQLIEKDAVRDETGKPADIGWWVNGDAHTDRPVMDTCLTALQLMVYYRNLPTTSKKAVTLEQKVRATATETNDIPVYLPLNL